MQYQLILNSDSVKLTEDSGLIKYIPNDPANSDWQIYQAWLAADPENQPELAEE